MATELVNFQGEMSRDRFKQECALVVLSEVLRAYVKAEVPLKSESDGKIIAAFVEELADVVAAEFSSEVPT